MNILKRLFGKRDAIEELDCPQCRGAGEIVTRHDIDPGDGTSSRVIDKRRCSTCGGTGVGPYLRKAFVEGDFQHAAADIATCIATSMLRKNEIVVLNGLLDRHPMECLLGLSSLLSAALKDVPMAEFLAKNHEASSGDERKLVSAWSDCYLRLLRRVECDRFESLARASSKPETATMYAMLGFLNSPSYVSAHRLCHSTATFFEYFSKLKQH